jgi:hypothetical protein
MRFNAVVESLLDLKVRIAVPLELSFADVAVIEIKHVTIKILRFSIYSIKPCQQDVWFMNE